VAKRPPGKSTGRATASSDRPRALGVRPPPSAFGQRGYGRPGQIDPRHPRWTDQPCL